ncbi:MAG: type II toxin-antitoxin system RelE/ParE family toxin [Methylococcales bacterium]|nr:type II toxin-antitoxin system RelE/ParE family toxin [Methylococcales bacterium]
MGYQAHQFRKTLCATIALDCNLLANRILSSKIKNFRRAGLQPFFETGSKAGICPEHAPRLKRILGILDAAMLVEQINIPGLKLHKLTGNLIGFWAVTVSGNWRVIFRFENGEAMLLDYVDYH